jgi:hypothetical protein
VNQASLWISGWDCWWEQELKSEFLLGDCLCSAYKRDREFQTNNNSQVTHLLTWSDRSRAPSKKTKEKSKQGNYGE